MQEECPPRCIAVRTPRRIAPGHIAGADPSGWIYTCFLRWAGFLGGYRAWSYFNQVASGSEWPNPPQIQKFSNSVFVGPAGFSSSLYRVPSAAGQLGAVQPFRACAPVWEAPPLCT